MSKFAAPPASLDKSKLLQSSATQAEFDVWCHNIGELLIPCGASGKEFLLQVSSAPTRPSTGQLRPALSGVPPFTPPFIKHSGTIASDIINAGDDVPAGDASSSTVPVSSPAPVPATSSSASPPSFKYEHTDDGSDLTAFGWDKFDSDTALFEKLQRKYEDQQALTFALLLSAMSSDMKDKLDTQPTYSALRSGTNVLGLRSLLNQLLTSSVALQSITVVRNFINFKLDASAPLDSQYKLFTQHLSALLAAFSSTPGTLDSEALAAAIFLQAVPRPPHQEFVTQILAKYETFRGITALQIKSAYQLYLLNKATDEANTDVNSKRNRKKGSGGSSDANATAILASIADKERYKADRKHRTKEHPHNRICGEWEGPTPYVTGNIVCGHCYKNGHLYDNHPTHECADAIWEAAQNKQPEPTPASHPPFALPARAKPPRVSSYAAAAAAPVPVPPVSASAAANKGVANSALVTEAGRAAGGQDCWSNDEDSD